VRGTPISIVLKATDLGLRLGVKPPDTLIVESARSWSSDFAETLRDYKPQSLALLRLPFVMMYSQALGETIFFAEDEHTKAALVKAGAEEWRIYTKNELRVLCEQNRIAPFSDAELRKLHEIKRTFKAAMTE